jgi:hypothetical protein
LCTAIGARVRSPGVSWMSVREVVIEPEYVATLDGMRVTTPLRTVVDLARFSIRFGETEELIVRWLALHFGFDSSTCVDVMNRRRNLPNKRIALDRLECLG